VLSTCRSRVKLVNRCLRRSLAERKSKPVFALRWKFHSWGSRGLLWGKSLNFFRKVGNSIRSRKKKDSSPPWEAACKEVVSSHPRRKKSRKTFSTSNCTKNLVSVMRGIARMEFKRSRRKLFLEGSKDVNFRGKREYFLPSIKKEGGRSLEVSL